MQPNRRETPLELEIQSLLTLQGSADYAVPELLKKYELVPLPLATSELIATFCLHAGLTAPLIDFLTKQIELDGEIPWGHLAEALALTQEKLSGELSDALLEGAEAQMRVWHLARSHALDNHSPSLQKERDLRKRSQEEKLIALRRDLLMQADTLRSQELDVEEGDVLEKLLRIFPKDPQVRTQYDEHRQRKALRLLEAKTSRPPERDFDDVEPDLDEASLATLKIISDSMREHWGAEDGDAKMGLDFAVAQWMWENPESALDFVPPGSDSLNVRWMRAEILLRTRRYVLLLSELIEIEKIASDNPDTTFGVSYMRAQALWGVGRKFEALEMMEGIVNVKPNYRSAAGLLSQWRSRTR